MTLGDSIIDSLTVIRAICRHRRNVGIDLIKQVWNFGDIADMLVPELTRRGRYKTDYAEGTLREKLFGRGRARLRAPHPAAQYRPRVAASAAE